MRYLFFIRRRNRSGPARAASVGYGSVHVIKTDKNYQKTSKTDIDWTADDQCKTITGKNTIDKISYFKTQINNQTNAKVQNNQVGFTVSP